MGGSSARLTVKDSVEGMAEVIASQKLDSPLFRDYRGEPVPW
jgi:hypothetical protein